MGAIQSLQEGFCDNTGGNNSSTPSKEQEKRVLSNDPRSPTVEIFRTPILVDKTPSSKISDPRSPSNEFIRTPLNPTNNSPARQRHNAREATGVMTPVSAHRSESGIESADVSPISGFSLASAGLNKYQSPDSAVSEEEEDMLVGDISVEIEPVLSLSKEQNQVQDSELVATSTPKSVNVLKQKPVLPLSRKLNQLEGSMARSPLTVVGNSPRLMMSNVKLPTARSEFIHNNTDKENIIH